MCIRDSQYGIGNPDVGDRRRAAIPSSRQKYVATLLAKERDSLCGLHRNSHDHPGRTVDPARQVNGNDRRSLRVHALDHGARKSFDRPIESGTEQGVDDDLRAVKSRRICHGRGPGPLFRRACRIALEPSRLADQQNLDPVAALDEQPCRHKSVAAIVARAGHNDGPAPRGMPRPHRVGHRPARLLHQIDARNPAGDRFPVGLRCFGVAQKLNHDASRIPIAAQSEHCRLVVPGH